MYVIVGKIGAPSLCELVFSSEKAQLFLGWEWVEVGEPGKTKPHQYSCIHCSDSGVNTAVNGVQSPDLPGLFSAGVCPSCVSELTWVGGAALLMQGNEK